ncbi:MAG: TetR/AcrR family transcriptional regulator, partial [Hadesarchaea archaeon]|nr:TetR/AcrR family transcriptional regulator [Hadesarchaea archaeon]
MTRKTSKERKKEIVKATLELIGEKGIESLRTSQIADNVGFSEAALYKHFPSKIEVVRATIQTAGKELLKSLKDSIKESETDNELTKLRIVLENHMEFVKNHP